MSCGYSPSFLSLIYVFCPHSLLSNREAWLFKYSWLVNIVPLSEKATWGETHMDLWERKGEEGGRGKEREKEPFFPTPPTPSQPLAWTKRISFPSVPPFSSGTPIAVMASGTGVCYHVCYLLLFSEHSSWHVVATQSLLLHDWVNNLSWAMKWHTVISLLSTVASFLVFINFWSLLSSTGFQWTVQVNFKSPGIWWFISLLLGHVNRKARVLLGSGGEADLNSTW